MGAKKDNGAVKWIIKSFFLTFFLAIAMNTISDSLLRNVSTVFAFIILIFIVLIGIVFDTIGMAVAIANEKPFNSMSSKKIRSAAYSLKLIKNASIVSNVCNDVIGDIVSVIVGSAVALILLSLGIGGAGRIEDLIISVLFISFISALTVGGKAYGKKLALDKWKEIVDLVGKTLYFLDSKLHVRLIK